MKIVISKRAGVEALSVVSKAVPTKDIVPICSGIKIEGNEDGKISFEATDLERTIVNTVEAQVLAAGQCVLPGKCFADLFKCLPDSDISIETDGSNAMIRYGVNETVINGFPAEEFPARNDIESGVSFEVKAADIKNAWKSILFATSKKEDRPIYAGVLFEFVENGVVFVTTDTHRLAWARIDVPGLEAGKQFILPGKVVNDVLKTPFDPDAVLQFKASENIAAFQAGNLYFITRLIDGKYPNYRQVIPGKDSIRFSFKANVDQLKCAVERACMVEGVLKFDITGAETPDTLNISSNAERGRVNELVPITDFSGEGFPVAFNGTYLIEALSAVSTEEVFFKFSGPLNPVLLIPCEEQKRSFSLLLPIRIREQ